MEATELRIGNSVIKSLLDGSMTQEYQIKGYDLKDFDKAIYEPIPLTEEWMKRIKLKEVGMSGWSFRRYFIDIKGGAIGIYRIFFRDSNSPMIEFRYVHQLQNLYFTLTGEELTIN